MPFSFAVKNILGIKNDLFKIALDLGFNIFTIKTLKINTGLSCDIKAFKSLLNKHLRENRHITCKVEKNPNKNDPVAFLGYFYDEFGRPITAPQKKNRYMAKKANPDIFNNLAL